MVSEGGCKHDKNIQKLLAEKLKPILYLLVLMIANQYDYSSCYFDQYFQLTRQPHPFLMCALYYITVFL